ncbi:MAG: hypothetical protein LBF19_05085 [Prevotellaceae bacterium]|jgi:cell fate regulator YaaT (PSP1 superfamily)|nr:hypothetical protein [Prevotellaceae bacterium]
MRIHYASDCERGCYKRQNDEQQWDVAACQGCCKLAALDWLRDLPYNGQTYGICEIRFKNTHKGYYSNVNELVLAPGDIVAVEAATGHDVGIVSLTGPLVIRQLMRKNSRMNHDEFKKIYRRAKPFDIEIWQEAIAREHVTMIKSRQIAAALKLDMKIGDVEFQGDGTKAIFYYIAEGRVDFRELIKRLADEFHIRIEMRQIGVRQEAGLIGGIGICGRELCCSQWMSGFTTVNTGVARWQDMAFNPQKLTGQCGRLKCCLNYEISTYVDAQKDFPNVTEPIETVEGRLFLQKTDILKGIMCFTTDPGGSGDTVLLPVEQVKEIMALNKKGIKAPVVSHQQEKNAEVLTNYKTVEGEDSITRFDKKQKSKQRNRRHHSPSKQKQTSSGQPAQ